MNSKPMLAPIFAASAILLAGGALSAWLARTHKLESMTVVSGLLGWLAQAFANAAGGILYLTVHVVLGEIFKHHLYAGKFRRRFWRRLGAHFLFPFESLKPFRP